MAVRQYIGARYVPKFADPIEWQNNTSYEALTVVTYNYASYTSKKPVPVGIAPTNSEYWVLTGNYNAQMNQILTEFAELKESFVNVRSYGATGNGSDDDTQAFVDMFADTDANGFFYIPDGNYRVTEPLSVPDKCTIICNGVIKSEIDPLTDRVHKGVLEIVNKTDVTIIGVNIVGQAPNNPVGTTEAGREPTWYCGIYTSRSDNIRIERCTIKNFEGGYCILAEYTTNYWVKDCYLNHYKWIGICTHIGCKHCNIVNNTVIDAYGRGTQLNSYPIKLSGYDEDPHIYDYHVEDITCIGNYVENLFPWWEGIDAHGGKNLVIANNTIVGVGTGIMVSDTNTDENKWKLDGCTISDNIITLPSNYDENAVPRSNNFCISAGGSNVTVTGNICENGGCAKRELGAHAGGMYVRSMVDGIVANNTFTNVCGEAFYFTGQCIDTRIENNVVHFTEDNDLTDYSYNYCLNAGYIGTSPIRVLVLNNTFKCASKNIVPVRAQADIPNTTYLRFQGTLFEGTTTAGIQPQNVVMDFQTSANMANVKMGMKGDIIKNPDFNGSGTYAWVCTASQGATFSGNPATWIALTVS